MILPTISLWQPWASLIAIGAKRFETRAYRPPDKYIGQRIAIHAAARQCRDNLMDVDGRVYWEIASTLFGEGVPPGELPPTEWERLPHGKVVCTAVLAGAYRCGGCGRRGQVAVSRLGAFGFESPTSIAIDAFGDYSPGRWAWLLTDVQPLDPPVPAKGKQGWWMWDDGSDP
ncbi:MAG: hypothetical protein ABT940_03125 [Alphaproteobacteria bacterium]